ncbi:nucleotidyltransferase domain-containing protein [Virgibacillus flavescens]|uniref:nucleotidyltransferase domain-containing protein n=1 Tax=Virgibacillus flavescens TaxID=1611422 RepID=UPI003D33DD19
MDGKKSPTETAKQFVNKNYPKAQGAILAGSVVRGEATSTSDLDIVIFDVAVPSAYRESVFDSGWPIEVFVHNLTSYKRFFEADFKRARPSLQRMVVEGTILRDCGIVTSIKQEAKDILDMGPEVWTEEVIRQKRYFITDALDDFIGSTDRSEQIFIANSLAELLHEFILRVNGHWIGASKWIVRALKQYDANFAEEFVNAFDSFYRTDEKEKVIELVQGVLAPYGGRLFEGGF